MRKAVKNNKDVETLAGVHTHTHTHTSKFIEYKKGKGPLILI